jgi:pimeloyl-ACP methyl ester carboxylesterase
MTVTLTEGLTGNYVEADGITLHYNEVGEGTPLVWIHGGGPGANSWSNFAANLPDFPGGYRHLLFDMPGYGKSEKVAIGERLFAYNARRIVAALRRLGVERAHFVGNSMGGGTSARIAIDHPEMVERLVLTGAAGMLAHSHTSAGELPDGLKVLMELFDGDITPERIERFARLMCYDQALVTPELLRVRLEGAREHNRALREADAVSRPNLEDLEPDLGAIGCPTLLVWGREDNFVPVRAGLAYQHGIPDARLVVLPRCGHWVQYEKLTLFNSLVAQFLTGEMD